ncbi:MAG: transporter family protein [Limisphaerales bacterium]
MNSIRQSNYARLPWSFVVLAGAGLASGVSAQAQGCIAVRGGGMCPDALSLTDPSLHTHAGAWQVGVGYRWLHSFRHFAGDEETRNAQGQTREEAGTEVINDSHFIDASVSYQITPRFSASLVLPFVYSDRSSLYEHQGTASGERYSTQAGGLADLRLSAYAWVWDPSKMPKGNLQLGLGLKAPTGDYRATDTFHTTRGPETHYVDQSIQPGDGGWGFTTEIFAWRQVHERVSLYLQGFYLFNPENVNQVSTDTGSTRGKTIKNIRNRAAAGDPTWQQYLDNATALGYNNEIALEDVMSIGDQYLGRAGVAVSLVPSWGLSLTFGGRIEGVPVEDAIGDTDGFRRPGYAVSVEPGLGWMRGRWSAQLLAPVAVYRNRQASVADERYGQITGAGTVSGDAAFADYSILANLSYRF